MSCNTGNNENANSNTTNNTSGNNNNTGNNNNSSNNNNSANNGPKAPPQPQPHPVLEQLQGVQYCVNSPPPWLEAILLGFQHYLLALGSIVLIPSILVPQMGGSDKEKAKVIQTLLFISGVNTMLHSFFGTRLPSVIGGSYAYLIPASSIIQSRSSRMINSPNERFVHTIREIQGALIVTSVFQMVLGFSGLWRNIVRYLTPLSMVPLVCFSGLGLYHLGFPLIAKCFEVGLPELIFMIIISQYLPKFIQPKKNICRRYALLFSIAFVWLYAEILTFSGAFSRSTHSSCRTDGSGLITGAPWIYVPYPFQWGPPAFGAAETFVAMLASLVASIESTGSFSAAARYGSATPVPASVLGRGVGWLGVGTLLNGIFGSVTGSNATVENAGLLALTKAGSRRVIQISAGFMIIFSILGKFGAIFASIPTPIMAGVYCIFFGYVSSAGLGFLQFCNLNSFRTKLILGLSFFIGLSLPQYFREHRLTSNSGPIQTHAQWFNDSMSVIFMSHATVAVLAALLLDLTLTHEGDKDRKDNGSYWWKRFMVYAEDVRNNEFYRLPGGGLNKWFPSI